MAMPPNHANHESDRAPIRSVRVPEELWAKAQLAVEIRGDQSVSHIIRRALMEYVDRGARRPRAAPPRRPGRPGG